MRFKLQLILITFAFITPSLVTAILIVFSNNSAAEVNMAGRQRMLTQKMTKEMITLSFDRSLNNSAAVEVSRRSLESSIKLFETTLNALINGGTTPKTLNLNGAKQALIKVEGNAAEQLQKVRVQWIEFKNLLLREIETESEETRVAVLQKNTPLLASMNIAVGLIEKQANEKTHLQKYFQIAGSILCIIIGILFNWYGNVYLRGPLKTLHTSLDAIAKGDLSESIQSNRNDVIGDLFSSAENMRGNLAEMLQDLKIAALQLSQNVQSLRENTNTLKENAAANDVEFIHIKKLCTEMNQEFQILSQESMEIDEFSKSSILDIESIGSNIAEIENSCNKERELTHLSNSKSQEATQSISQLGNAASEIGSVIEIITSIADQTNLLALNATIEAASAGEAGKGFAVVAQEVKALAKQTANATERISSQIHSIQNNTNNSVESVEKIGELIEDVTQISDRIFVAVKEQRESSFTISSTFQKTSTNIQTMNEYIAQLSKKSQDITANQNSLESSLTQITQASENTSKQADEISSLSVNLEEMVQQFKLT